MRAQRRVRGLALITDDIAEMLKMQHITMDPLGWGGATASSLTFLESSRRADVKLKLTCNAATYRFRDICG